MDQALPSLLNKYGRQEGRDDIFIFIFEFNLRLRRRHFDVTPAIAGSLESMDKRDVASPRLQDQLRPLTLEIFDKSGSLFRSFPS